MGLGDRLAARVRALYRENTAPLAPLAALGLAALLLFIDDHSVPAILHTSSSGDKVVSFLASVPLVAGLYLCWMRKPQPRFAAPSLLLAGIAGSLCFDALIIEPAATGTVRVFLAALSNVLQAILAFFWAKALITHGARKMATIFSLAIVCFAALSCVTLVLRDDMAHLLMLSLPAVSSVCLVAFLHANRTAEPPVEAAADTLYIYPCSTEKRSWPYYLASTFVPLICFAIAFGELHFSWTKIQDGSSLSMIVQMGTLFGSLVGGLVVLGFVLAFWTRENVHILKASLPMIMLLAFWFTSSNTEAWVFCRLMLLNITHKLVYLLIWLTPFMFDLGRDRLAPFALSYLAFEVGKVISGNVPFGPDDTGVSTSLALVFSILVLCSMLPSLVYNSLEKHATSKVALTQPVRVARFRNAVQDIAQRYELTPREAELLRYLGKGYTSAYIADKLCISNATAKTHQKNIYTKLKVHSQQDLLLLIDATIAEQFEPEAYE